MILNFFSRKKFTKVRMSQPQRYQINWLGRLHYLGLFWYTFTQQECDYTYSPSCGVINPNRKIALRIASPGSTWSNKKWVSLSGPGRDCFFMEMELLPLPTAILYCNWTGNKQLFCKNTISLMGQKSGTVVFNDMGALFQSHKL